MVTPLPEINPLRPGLWILDAVVEDFSVRSVLAAGESMAVVWDTLARPEDLSGLATVLSENGPSQPGPSPSPPPDTPITVVYSHADWDHVWGTTALEGRIVEIIAHEACGDRFVQELPDTLRGKRAESLSTYGSVRLMPPTRTFKERLTLDLGALTLEMHHLPGHTPDTAVGFIPEWGVFLAGDAVETPLPFLNPGSPIRVWAERLEEWAEVLDGEAEPPVVIPSQGTIGGPELLLANAKYLRDLAAGRDPGIPGDLSPFYTATHTRNRTLSSTG
jgi:glyoxylase-like metal-dependent hydrolase (beta-lactamase superfamily II)